MPRSLIIGRPTITFDTIESTNDYATLLLSNSTPNEGTVIWAHYQSKGRGQIGSNWTAEAGKNLLMSVILQPKFLMAHQQFALNIMSSLAIHSALKSFGIDTHIKWPNDIYVGHNKICGILIQNILQGKSIKNAVIGIGLNVNQLEFDPILPNPVSMKMITNQIYSLEDIKSQVCRHLQECYYRLEEEGFETLKSEYLECLYLKDRKSSFMIMDEEIFGVIQGISDLGRLQIEIDGELREFNFREIKYIHS